MARSIRWQKPALCEIRALFRCEIILPDITLPFVSPGALCKRTPDRYGGPTDSTAIALRDGAVLGMDEFNALAGASRHESQSAKVENGRSRDCDLHGKIFS